MLYMFIFNCWAFKQAKHDTISSSIYDATSISKRIFNVALGFASFALICLHVDEIESRYTTHPKENWWFYILEVVACFCIMSVGMFPGGTAYRRDPKYIPLIDILHSLVSGVSILALTSCNFFSAYTSKREDFGWVCTILSVIGGCAAIVFVAFAELNSSKGQGKGKVTPLLTRPTSVQKLKQFDIEGNYIELRRDHKNRYSYLAEMIAFYIAIAVSVVSSWHRNENLPF